MEVEWATNKVSKFFLKKKLQDSYWYIVYKLWWECGWPVLTQGHVKQSVSPVHFSQFALGIEKQYSIDRHLEDFAFH